MTGRAKCRSRRPLGAKIRRLFQSLRRLRAPWRPRRAGCEFLGEAPRPARPRSLGFATRSGRASASTAATAGGNGCDTLAKVRRGSRRPPERRGQNGPKSDGAVQAAGPPSGSVGSADRGLGELNRRSVTLPPAEATGSLARHHARNSRRPRGEFPPHGSASQQRPPRPPRSGRWLPRCSSGCRPKAGNRHSHRSRAAALRGELADPLRWPVMSSPF